MGLAISPYTPDLQPAVAAFNQRLRLGGVNYKFPDADRSISDATTHRRSGFVAVQDGQDVRGGYLIDEQDFWLDGRRERLGFLQLPLSEGLIDRRFSTLGIQLIAHALKRQPLLFGLGIGGHQEAFARVISALGWKLAPVPFQFKILRPARVAHGLRAIRSTRARQMMCDLAAVSGAAAVASWALQRRTSAHPRDRDRSLVQVEGFDAIGDALWERFRDRHQLIGWRDAAALRHRYPTADPRFLRWMSRSGSDATGWVVALDTQMAGHKYFGNLRVSTIVDCFGDPEAAPALVRGVERALAARGADLIITNQASRSWGDAFAQSGFLTRPSNFLFAAPPRLQQMLGSFSEGLGRFHLTRGDGDGPINL